MIVENFNYETFKNILRCTQKDLMYYLKPQLKEIYKEEDCIITDRFLFAKGISPVCLLAHLDTVHRDLPSTIVCDKESGYLWSPQGIGGDDRCGVYALISIIADRLKNGKDLPSVLFLTDEEIGCIGAGFASNEIPEDMYKDFKFLVEIDRKGTEDCVFYQTYNDKFVEFIESFGFHKEYGSCSDISKISPIWNVASVNLSSGYFNQHTKEEYISTEWLVKTINRVIDILDSDATLNGNKFEYQPDKPVTTTASSYYDKYYSNYNSKNNFKNGSWNDMTDEEIEKEWDNWWKENDKKKEEHTKYSNIESRDKTWSKKYEDEYLERMYGKDWREFDFYAD